MFLWTSCPFISGRPLLACCVRLEVVTAPLVGIWVVYLGASLLVMLIWCQIIFTASIPGVLLSCRSLAIRLPFLQTLPSGQVRLGISRYKLLSTLLIPHSSAAYNAVVTRLLHIHTSSRLSRHILFTLFSARHVLYPSFILCTTSLSQLPYFRRALPFSTVLKVIHFLSRLVV